MVLNHLFLASNSQWDLILHYIILLRLINSKSSLIIWLRKPATKHVISSLYFCFVLLGIIFRNVVSFDQSPCVHLTLMTIRMASIKTHVMKWMFWLNANTKFECFIPSNKVVILDCDPCQRTPSPDTDKHPGLISFIVWEMFNHLCSGSLYLVLTFSILDAGVR